MSVVTAVTAQNTRGVLGVWPVPEAGIEAQLRAVFDDLPVDVIKIGMVGTAAGLIARVIHSLGERPLIVLDPVMVAKGGASLLPDDAIAALVDELVPLATLVTPNLPEAAALSAVRPGWERGRAVLYKGGHAEGAEVVDRLCLADGSTRQWAHPRSPSRHTHGTGCTLAAAIAAKLGLGIELGDACEQSTRYVSQKIRISADAGLASSEGHGPLLHGEIQRRGEG